MTKSFDDYFQEKMKDPVIKQEYDALEPEYAIIQAMIDARKSSGLTQKQLSERTGMTQGISAGWKTVMQIRLCARSGVLQKAWA